jgi:hypothetical protein
VQRTIAFRIFLISFVITLVMIAVFFVLNHYLSGNYWDGMKVSKSALTVEYCEYNDHSSFFHQRMNTYSNLGYFFLGMAVMLISFYDQKDKYTPGKNLLQQFPALSFFFGCCLVYLCFGSAFFHASLTWPGQRVDMNGTYSISIALLGISLYRLFGKNQTQSFKRVLLAILFLTVLLCVELHLLISSFVLLPLMILSIVIITIINAIQNKSQFNAQPAFLSLLSLMIACVLRVLDVKKIGCDPLSFYQGHSLWHIFTGLSAFLLYWFYRTENTLV